MYQKYKFIVYGVIVFLICVMSAYLYINNNKKYRIGTLNKKQ